MKYDLIVAGGGFSGTAAAISAGRAGMKTLLVEKGNCLGGAAVINLVNPFMRYWTDTDAGRQYLSRGLFEEIHKRLRSRDAVYKNHLCFDEEILKSVLEELAQAAGVDILYNAMVTDVKASGRTLESVTLSGSFGNQILSADRFIDATGDGVLAFLAGCSFRLGREEDGLCQPMTLCFRVANADVEKVWSNRPKMDRLYREFKARGELDNPREDVLIMDSMIDGVIHFNSTRVIKYNPVDMWENSKAEMEGRRQAVELFQFLKKHMEGFENARLCTTAARIGVRESRLLKGKYILTAEDLLKKTMFSDRIAVSNYDMDIHNPEGEGTTHIGFGPGEYYSIPYSSMVTREFDNLLVTGRCASFSHEAQAAVRIMPTCCCMGEAAGVAAGVAFESGSSFEDVDIALLQKRLRENGAAID